MTPDPLHSTAADFKLKLECDLPLTHPDEPAAFSLTDRSVAAFDRDGRTLWQLTAKEIQQCRLVPLFGGTLLQIQAGDVWIDALRASNRGRDRLERAAQVMNRRIRGDLANRPEIGAPETVRCPKCALKLSYAGEVCPRCVRHRAALRRIFSIVKPHWRPTLVLTSLLFLGTGLDMLWPLLTRYLVDHVLAAPAAATARDTLLLVVLALALAQVCRAGLNALSGRIGSRLGNVITHEVRSQLVTKLGQVGLSFFYKQQTGSLVSKILYDSEAVYGFINQITAGFLMQVILVVSSVLLMFSLDPVLAMLALAPAPLILLGASVYWRWIYPFFQRYMDRASRQVGSLNSTLGAIELVKVFGQQRREYFRFQRSASNLRQLRERVDGINALFHPGMAVVFQIGGWLIWYLGGRSVLDQRISLGTLMAFFGYMGMFYGPLGGLTNFTTWLTQFSVQVHRLAEILDAPEEPKPRVSAGPPIASAPAIEFKNVTFGYRPEVPVLKNVSFTILPGEDIGIVGKNGSGKTSITKALCHLYPLQAGEVLVEGRDVRTLSQAELRSEIGMVLQEGSLVRGTIAENIAYGKTRARLETILDAAQAVNAHEFIVQRPLAYDSLLGDGGQGLSGGERQKLNLARALLCRPNVLVMDEATSEVDAESCAIIQQSVRRVLAGSSFVTIAHRANEIARCTRVLVMEEGRLVEMGSPAELLKREGAYASWIRAQAGAPPTTPEPPTVAPPATGPSPGSAIWIRPDMAQFERGPFGELQLRLQDRPLLRGLHVLRCFPLSAPDEFLSVRSSGRPQAGPEIGLIRNLKDWPDAQRELVRQSLQAHYCFTSLTRLLTIRKADQLLICSTQTESAPVELVVRDNPDSVQEYGPHGALLTDLEGSLYLVRDVTALPRSDQSLFARYFYWLPDPRENHSHSRVRHNGT